MRWFGVTATLILVVSAESRSRLAALIHCRLKPSHESGSGSLWNGALASPREP